MSVKWCAATSLLLTVLAHSAFGVQDFLCPQKEDHAFSLCLIGAFQKYIRGFVKGYPEYGVPVLDPLVIPQVSIIRHSPPTFESDAVFTNYAVSEITHDAKVKSVKYRYSHLNELDIYLEIARPKAVYEGAYKLKGKILYLPLWGSGHSVTTMHNTVERLHMHGPVITKDGKRYWDVTQADSRLEPKSVTLLFDNLFNGNRILGAAANALMNKQWKLIMDQISEQIDAAFSAEMLKHWRSTFLHIPLDEAFPNL